ncbi:hypothetical protein BGX27_001510 [Mortierella sp. AM989]|nr:hypothetical protein BGX27_001510 [Mortierella sp. AM989]
MGAIDTTDHGLDYYLTEIRNAVKTKEDIQAIWGDCEPEKVQILGLDLGQAYVVGASALLPNTKAGKSSKDGTTKTTIFHNLPVKQKAVYQPTFKLRRWLEDKKRVIAPGTAKSTSDIETSLPPLRGEDASTEKYVKELENVESQLRGFYDCDKQLVKRHQWDAKKARDVEYGTITNRLLKMVEGSIDRKRSDDRKVVIGVGPGQFSSSFRLLSLHGSFLSFFVQKLGPKDMLLLVLMNITPPKNAQLVKSSLVK